MIVRTQRYTTYMLYTLVADAAGIPLRDVFWDAAAIVDAYRRLQGDLLSPRLREALAPYLRQPALAALSYGHVAALGCALDTPQDGEPRPRPCLAGPDGAAALRDPPDFLQTPLIRERLRVAAEVERLWGGGIRVSPAAGWEGPLTTAVLMAGADFLTWPIERPAAAHALLRFVTESAARYAQAYRTFLGEPWPMRSAGICDDFAGLLSPALFDDFVLPYWDLFYTLVGAERRSLHSELLRAGHLSLLPHVGIEYFDPGADQYLTPELLREHCPVPFQLRILDWHLRDNTPAALQAMYCRFASFEPAAIQFGIERVSEEEKYLAILDVARELAGEA